MEKLQEKFLSLTFVTIRIVHQFGKTTWHDLRTPLYKPRFTQYLIKIQPFSPNLGHSPVCA